MIKKNILVINCGSSSIKFSIINPINEKKILTGITKHLKNKIYLIKWKINNINYKKKINKINSNLEILKFIFTSIIIKNKKIFKNLFSIGHRIVHGGEHFSNSVIINDKVINSIKDSIKFAPLHNSEHLIGIYKSFKYFPNFIKKNIAVFDTAFHQSIPKKFFLYALPYNLYKKYKIRKYGAHGISHKFITLKTANILNKEIKNINIISCHLGNGCSISAIKNGKCIDTSMGLTPLEGLVMGTRCGDIDSSIIFYLYNFLGIKIDKINKILNNESGLLGISEISNDLKYIEKNYKNKKNFKLAIDIFCHRLSKYIGSYITLFNKNFDALVFTGGIGENSELIRELTINSLNILNFKIDKILNKNIYYKKSGIITKFNSRLALVIPSNEELIIAKDSYNIINNNKFIN
ncbi:acetate kinase [Enterobacterales bacterium endosymbiont of Anomoneura mori]|uniref:acetate kinase n=1 Tax=Enterobacterales bacterium endosymbiont of Anomoneura mori TaxID=3132096 RepID=UPI00399CC763